MNSLYFIIYKPFNVLSSFSSSDDKKNLSDFFSLPKDIYPVGRLDYDSEGLLILTNDKKFNHLLLDPINKHKRKYLVQIEGDIHNSDLIKLESGLDINISGKIYHTLPAKAKIIDEPSLPLRIPPIRFRQNIPTNWIELELIEGKNRQVRKMTAKVGFPTLRLIRYSIEDITIDGLNSGDIRQISRNTIYKKLNLINFL